MNIVAIIPARGGSKGIPKKNLINFRGKPLIQWSIEAALQSKYITDVVISSDSDEILSESKKNDKVITLKRPSFLAQDQSRTEPVLLHALENLEKKYNYLILLQPTSPLRTAEDIDKAFEKIFEAKTDTLISVTSLDFHPFKTFTISNSGYLKGIINNDYPFFSRQQLPKTYKANGAIYIIETNIFINNKSLITEQTIPFEMSNEKSLDIDTLDDLK